MLDEFAKAKIQFGSCVWLLEQKLKKAAVEAWYLTRVRDAIKRSRKSQWSLPARLSKGRADDFWPWRLGPSARLRPVRQYTNDGVKDAVTTSELNFMTIGARRRDAQRPFAKAPKITIESIARTPLECMFGADRKRQRTPLITARSSNTLMCPGCFHAEP